MAFLLILLGAALVQLLAETYYRKNWDKKLKVSLRFQASSIWEGEESLLTETIENEKRLFLPMLQVGFGVSRNLYFGQEENTSVSDKSYKRDIFSVMGRQRITRQVSFLAQKRGYYEIDKIELVTRGLLFQSELYKTGKERTSLYVYPGRIQGLEGELFFRRLSGIIETRNQMLEDPFQFRGIREYIPLDPMNRINWKASARTGELMVNQMNSSVSGNVCLLLDVEDVTMWRYEEIHEEGIRLAAAMAQRLLRQGMEVGLLTNGRDCVFGEEIYLEQGGGQGQIAKLLQSLSRIDLSKKPDRFTDSLEKKKEILLSRECFCILITQNQYPGLVSELEFLGRRNHGSLYVATLAPDMELKIESGGQMQVYRWEVRP